MDDIPRVIEFPARPSAEPVAESAHTRAYILAPGAPLPDGADAFVTLPDGARFVYVPRAPLAGASGMARALDVDPGARGNRFMPIHESERALAALLSIAASRRLDTGPESERLFLFLRGSGLLFTQDEQSHRFAPNTLALVPPGEPARIWAQGPEDVLAVVFQPRGQQAERRTLASELAKRRAQPQP